MVVSVLEHFPWACGSLSERSGCLNCFSALWEAPSAAKHESYESLCLMGSSTRKKIRVIRKYTMNQLGAAVAVDGGVWIFSL